MSLLTRVTRGRIRPAIKTKALTLAVSGLLFIVEIATSDTTTTVYITPSILKPIYQGPTYGGSYYGEIEIGDDSFLDKKRLLLQEDEELMLIIKIFIKCQE